MNTPDPQRLGGVAWVRRTGGQLSRAERRGLLVAIAVGQWENAVGRAKLALGRLPAAAAHVDLDTFRTLHCSVGQRDGGGADIIIETSWQWKPSLSKKGPNVKQYCLAQCTMDANSGVHQTWGHVPSG